MPRKKASELPMGSPGKIICPACKSEVSSDGATLHKMSGYLEGLIEDAGGLEKLEKALAQLEEKLSARDADFAKLQQEIKSKTEGPKNETVGQGPKRGDWW